MIGASFAGLGRDILLRLDPETAHGLAIRALSMGLAGSQHMPRDKRLEVRVGGLRFAHPIGMAAGFDKNAEVAQSLFALGFSSVEIGTVTPLPQPGNPKPRMFRLSGHEAIINRLGFNNHGHATVLARLKHRSRRAGILGANIGANKDSADRIADYIAGVRAFAPVADYLTVNISSPNTPGLRDLQSADNLAALLGAIAEARKAAGNVTGTNRPIFLKVAPDLDQDGIEAIAREVLAHRLDGIIVSNTTLARETVKGDRMANEAGGLSGRPLFDSSTVVLARMRRAVGKDLTLIGVGGVSDAEQALTKIKAGADLVQCYTGFIYRGASLPRDIVSGLVERLDADGSKSIADYRDTAMEEWAARSLTP